MQNEFDFRLQAPEQKPDFLLSAELPVYLPPDQMESGEQGAILAGLAPLLSDCYSDPLAALNASRTMLLPHQVSAAVRVVDSIRPRFLIADEVGLGKTIEAGLILKELTLKYGYQSILILVPAPLVSQWQTEMREKFNEHYSVLTGSMLRDGETGREHRLLGSVDLARDPRYRSVWEKNHPDIVVFDEAHRLRRDEASVTQAYSLAECLAANSRSLLLLSATPFRGKIEELFYLIRLIDPDILGPLHTFLARYGENPAGLREKLAPVVIRRRKTDVGGFVKRFARTVMVSLSPEERSLYDSVTEYVSREFNKAIASGQRMQSFVMIVFQKLLDSSSYALLQALRRRHARLRELLSSLEIRPETALPEELSDDESDEDLTDHVTLLNPDDIRSEIITIEALLRLGDRIGSDNKLIRLEKTIQAMKKEGHSRFLIFTQFRSTLEYLERYFRISMKTYVFHGGLSNHRKDEAIAGFYADGELLILTEAGGEGRNLQIATALINYDLPWSPLRIEQRIGRIHRFGQTRDVHIVNFASKDTVAERVLDILERKIRLFEDTLGEADELLGLLEDESEFRKGFLSFLRSRKSAREAETEFDRAIVHARENMQKIGSLLSTDEIPYDLGFFRQAHEHQVIRRHADNESLLSGIVLRAAPGSLVRQGDLLFTTPEGRTASFLSHHAREIPDCEYIAFGHPLVDRVTSAALQRGCGYGTTEGDHELLTGGWYFVIRVRIAADKPQIRYYPFYYDPAGQLREARFSWSHRQVKVAPADEIRKDFSRVLRQVRRDIMLKIDTDLAKIRKRLLSGSRIISGNILESSAALDAEISGKLEIQRSRESWYQESNASVIKRHENQLASARRRAANRLRNLEQITSMQARADLLQIIRIR